MKKLLILLAIVAMFPISTYAQFSVPQGGTGKTSFPQNSLIYADNGGLQRLQATSSPTIGYIQGTSTTATSTLPNLAVTAISIAGEYISNFTSYVRGLFSGTSPIVYTLATGVFSCPTCNTSSATVSSVGLTSSDSSLTISSSPITTSGTLGAVLNLTNINSWTARQSFARASTTQQTFQGPVYDNTNSPGTSAQVMTSNGPNVAPSWQTTTSAGKTIRYMTATSSLSDTTSLNYVSTSTPITAGQQIHINFKCNIAGTRRDGLNVGNPGGGTTTLDYSLVSTGANVSTIVMSGVYTATTTGNAFVSVDTTSDFISYSSETSCRNPSIVMFATQ